MACGTLLQPTGINNASWTSQRGFVSGQDQFGYRIFIPDDTFEIDGYFLQEHTTLITGAMELNSLARSEAKSFIELLPNVARFH